MQRLSWLRGARRQDGISILELTLSIALSALMLAPLAAILWQVTAAPAQSTGSIDVVNQVPNVDINVPDDVRRARYSQRLTTPCGASWRGRTSPEEYRCTTP